MDKRIWAQKGMSHRCISLWRICTEFVSAKGTARPQHPMSMCLLLQLNITCFWFAQQHDVILFAVRQMRLQPHELYHHGYPCLRKDEACTPEWDLL